MSRRWRRRLVIAGVVVLVIVGAVVALFAAVRAPTPPVRDYVAEYKARIATLGGDPESAFALDRAVGAMADSLRSLEDKAAQDVLAGFTSVDAANVSVSALYRVASDITSNAVVEPSLLASARARELYRESDIPAKLTAISRRGRDAWIVASPGRPLESTTLTSLNGVRQLALYERGRFTDALQRGDSAAAAESFENMAMLARAISAGPYLVTNLVSHSIVAVMGAATREGVNGGTISPELAASMLRSMEDQVAHRTDVAYSLDGERIMILDTLQWFYGTDPTRTQPARVSLMNAILNVHGGSYRQANRMYDVMAREASLPRRSRNGRALVDIETTIEMLPDRYEVLRTRIPAVWRVIEHTDNSLCVERGTRLVLALEVYRGKHGGYPMSLEALVPEVIGELPRDPYAPDGMFRYRLQGASERTARVPMAYRLYTVGADGADDGGTMPERGMDAIWTYGPGGDMVLNAVEWDVHRLQSAEGVEVFGVDGVGEAEPGEGE